MLGEINENKYDITYVDGIRIVTAKFWADCEDKIGTYMEDTDWDFIVEEDTDFYAPSNFAGVNNEDNIIFKYRKNIFTADEQLGAYDGLLGAAQPTQNRGMAAGPKGESQGQRDWCTDEQVEVMDYFINRPNSSTLFEEEGDPIENIKQKYLNSEGTTRGIVWLRTKIDDAGYNYKSFFKDKVEEWKVMGLEEASKDANVIKSTFISDTTYANVVLSGIAGFFDRYPRIPYGRATSYTEHNRDTFEKCYPFMRKLSNEFANLVPKRYGVQLNAANKLDERFRVAGKDTPFTTITVNKNFRTACHRDAGDLNEGFSNLTVVAKDKNWTGGYLVLPEFRVGINIRPGDLLLINNHGGIHGNTKLLPPEGVAIEDMERISLVCYFREKMLELGSWEYETLRRNFVDYRRKDKSHPLWKHLWNGVSEKMWDSDEWYEYLREHGGVDMLGVYHPEAVEEKPSLESFFG